MVDPATFRNVLAQWPSGVTIVTTLDAEGQRKGMTASSFSSVSAEPPMVSVCLLKSLYTHKLISESGVFGVNILAKDQMDVARKFAGMTDVEDRFDGEDWTIAETGVSLLDSALGWLDCRVLHEYDGGSHTIFVGEVMAAHNARRAAPLLYHSRGWGQFADVLPDVATVSDSATVELLRSKGHEDEIQQTTEEITAAGVRLRVADLTTAAPAEQTLAQVAWPSDRSRTTALVADRIQAQQALDAGAGMVELIIDPAANGDLERAVTCVEGIADRVAVELVNPFAAERHDAVAAAVEILKSAGVKEICLPDTDGSATALEVRSLLQEIVPMARPLSFRIRLHGSDRLGLVKGLTALKSGARDFDTALESLGDGAAVEDLVRLLGTLDVDSDVDTAAITALAVRLTAIDTTTDTPVVDRATLGAAG